MKVPISLRSANLRARATTLMSYLVPTCLAGLLAYNIAPRVLPSPSDYRYISEVKRHLSDRPIILAGKGVRIASVDLRSHAYTWILFTSPDCSFCGASAQFHRRLYLEATKRGAGFIVALPVAKNAHRYLKWAGLEKAQTADWEHFSRRPQGTPSIVLVSGAGGIRRVWLGQLGPGAENEVMSAVRNPEEIVVPPRHLPSGEAMLSLGDLTRLRATERIRIISIAERGTYGSEHLEGAINIPLAELSLRAPMELNEADLNVIDCSTELNPRCSLALRTLSDLGFRSAPLDVTADPGS